MLISIRLRWRKPISTHVCVKSKYRVLAASSFECSDLGLKLVLRVCFGSMLWPRGVITLSLCLGVVPWVVVRRVRRIISLLLVVSRLLHRLPLLVCIIGRVAVLRWS